jgi:hypothetical protein
LALLKAPPNHTLNINRKSVAHLNPAVYGRRIGLISGGKQLKTAGKPFALPAKGIAKGIE